MVSRFSLARWVSSVACFLRRLFWLPFVKARLARALQRQSSAEPSGILPTGLSESIPTAPPPLPQTLPMPAAPVETSPMATLSKLSFTSSAGRPVQYTVRPGDLMAMYRAVNHEGRPHRAVAWTLLQRFAHLYGMDAYPTLQSLVQAYVQPINPRWFPDGDLHLRELGRLERTGAAQARIDDERARARRRVRYASEPLSAISSRALAAVDSILSGLDSHSPVARAVHYRASVAPAGATDAQAQAAAEAFARAREGWFSVNAAVGYKRGVNVFFGVGRSARRAADWLRVSGGLQPFAPAALTLGFGGVLLLAAKALS